MERNIIPIIGKSGFGKTYLMRTLLVSIPRSIVIDQRGEYDGDRFTDFDQMADALQNRPTFRAVWVGGQDYAQAVFHLGFALGNVSLIMEEADLLDPEGWYREAIYRGREPYRISLYPLAQRPHLLAPDIRSQMDQCYVFNTSEPSALQWLGSVFSKDDLAQMAQLPRKHGLHYSITDAGPVTERFRLP